MSDIQGLKEKYKINKVLKNIDSEKLHKEIRSNPEKYIYKVCKLISTYDAEISQALREGLYLLLSNPIIDKHFIQLASWCHIDSMMRQASKGKFSYDLICPKDDKITTFLCSLVTAKRAAEEENTPGTSLQPDLPYSQELEELIFGAPLDSVREQRLLEILQQLDPIQVAFLQKMQADRKSFSEIEQSALYWADSRYLSIDPWLTRYLAAFLYSNDEKTAKTAVQSILDVYVIEKLKETPTLDNPRIVTQLQVLDWSISQYHLRDHMVTTLLRQISIEFTKDESEVDPALLLLTLESMWKNSHKEA